MKQPDLLDLADTEFPTHAAVLRDVTARVTSLLPGADLDCLARRSPALRGFDWATYLRASVLRLGYVLRHLDNGELQRPGRVLDYGSYFGNFAIGVQLAGYQVTAVDSYSRYEGALEPWQSLMLDCGIEVLDFEVTGYGLDAISPANFDAILCMGVLEHIPHTPRETLESLNRTLKPGGRLILDTPNLAYLYKRRQLNEGNSVFAPIETQYFTEVPFEGHHREYTRSEVEWMLAQIGHRDVAWEMFNYSFPALPELNEQLLEDREVMALDEDLREIILSVSRRPAQDPGPTGT